MLFKKLLRTVGKYKAQFISMIIMIALGVGVFIGFNVEWYSIEKNVDYAFEQTGFADFRLVNETGFGEADLASVSGIDGVEKAARYVSVNTTVKGSKNVIALTVSTDISVSGFSVISGEEYDAASIDGIWISDRYAEKNGVLVGDGYILTYKGKEISGVIKGLVKSGEYLICLLDDAQVMPDYETSGFAYISPAAYENALGFGFYPQINVISSLNKKEFSQKANEALGKTTMVVAKEDVVSYSEAMGEATEGKTMGSILPVLFLAIAILTMITTMHRITTNEKIQIGTLKALGFKDGKIKRHYVYYALFIGVIGTLFGVGLGFGLAYYIMNPDGAMGTYLDMPRWNLCMPWFCILVLVAVNLLLVSVGYLSVRKMLKGSACDALRPYVPKKVKNLKMEKTKTWDRLSFGTKWNLRDVFRHKSRSFMTLIGVLGCVILIVASFGMRDTMNAFVDVFYNKAIEYRTVINISEEAENTDALAICEEYGGDWAAKSAVEIGDKAVSLEIYSLPHGYVKFVNDKLNFVSLTGGGVFICSRLSRELNAKEGDYVTFSPYGGNEKYQVKVNGIINSMTEGVFMEKEYAEEIGFDYKISTVYTVEKDIAQSEFIRSVMEKEAIIKSFDTFMDVMNKMIFLLVIAAMLLGLIVLYNLGVMSYIERYGELATLKVVGFKDKQIGKILISQNLWITALGIIIGIPLGIGILDYLIKALAAEYEMVLVLSAITFIVSVAATLIVSLAVSFIISKKNGKINMVEALKRTE